MTWTPSISFRVSARIVTGIRPHSLWRAAGPTAELRPPASKKGDRRPGPMTEWTVRVAGSQPGYETTRGENRRREQQNLEPEAVDGRVPADWALHGRRFGLYRPGSRSDATIHQRPSCR